MNPRMGHAIPRYYYLMTPVFILLDYAVGVNIRVAALDAMPLYKNLYYGFCIVCGIVVFVWPLTSAVVALLESAIIILITIWSLFRPIIESLEQVAELSGDWKAVEVLQFEGTTNLLMAATIAVLAFRMNAAALAGRSDPTGPDAI
jgi:hypothetical protein